MTIFAIIFSIGFTDDFINDEIISFLKRNLKRSVIIAIISGILTIVVPSKQELYVIYGIGGTIDYLKENPNAQKLPNNIINAANKFLENYQSNK